MRRRPDPDDGRATLAEATPAGHALRDHVERIWTHLEELTVGDMTPAERAAALTDLRRLEENVLSTELCMRFGRTPAKRPAPPG